MRSFKTAALILVMLGSNWRRYDLAANRLSCSRFSAISADFLLCDQRLLPFACHRFWPSLERLVIDEMYRQPYCSKYRPLAATVYRQPQTYVPGRADVIFSIPTFKNIDVVHLQWALELFPK